MTQEYFRATSLKKNNLFSEFMSEDWYYLFVRPKGSSEEYRLVLDKGMLIHPEEEDKIPFHTSRVGAAIAECSARGYAVVKYAPHELPSDLATKIRKLCGVPEPVPESIPTEEPSQAISLEELFKKK